MWNRNAITPPKRTLCAGNAIEGVARRAEREPEVEVDLRGTKRLHLVLVHQMDPRRTLSGLMVTVSTVP